MAGTDKGLIGTVAEELLAAEAGRHDVASFGMGTHPELDEDAGYAVQDRIVATKLGDGQRIVGAKLGLTSRAKQQQMNVDVPIVGWLTDQHRLERGRPIPADRFIHPKVEPEIFFTLATDLSGADTTPQDVAAAVDGVYAGLDVIDSRYRNFKFTLGDVVADDCSAAGYILGPVAKRIDSIDLELEAVIVEVNGKVVKTATGAAILGSPLLAVAEGVRLLARRGQSLRAGQVVLAGAMTDALPVVPGQTVRFSYSNLGCIELPPVDPGHSADGAADYRGEGAR